MWFEVEARIGQHGTLTTVWAAKGSRPTAVKQTAFECAYISAMINPVTGDALALITPDVNTALMNDLLANLSKRLGDSKHAILVWDNAGFHKSGTLEVPANVTLLPLPPYSPELNRVERVWLWMRVHHLSNRAFDDAAHVERAIAASCAQMEPERLKSICHTDWLERGN